MTIIYSYMSNAVCTHAGTHHDLVEALVFTRPGQVDLNIINGRVIVQDGKMLTVDIPVSITHYCNVQATRQASAVMAEGLHHDDESSYTCIYCKVYSSVWTIHVHTAV